MNSTFEATDYLQSEAPDLAVLRQSKQYCNDKMIDIEVFYTQTSYLPSLYGKFNRLNSTLNQAHTRLRDGTQRLQYDLDSQANVLRGYLKELAESSDDTERLEILADAAKEMNAVLKSTRNEASTLAASLLSISEPFERTSTLRNLLGFNTELERLPEEIQEIEASRAKVEAERATLTAAINAIESKGFGAIAQDAILTGEKIAALGPTPPEAAVIALALDLLKQSLDKLDASLNFLGLIRMRDVLRERSNAYAAALRDKQLELGAVGRRISLIDAAHLFDDELQTYKREYSKVVDAVRAYEARFNRMSTVDEFTAQAFIADTTALAAYLRPIR
ncbi:alpha-xenorhabdolysin family binary toxin subunit B [Pseudomonas sp. ICMP 561]|uniref:alpha-xenorhabdolysin family binary toxin subunit B n=1 Tax=Pseudomonas sp. ICMP 561 TaxID=1718918 RepID=UPI000C088F93|nr:alpha-xenorhabdolysin family binary toxin subunit B [Pseudomonas sp. ICMP 561]PHN28574.1 hypothetical protein AO242_03185 [Pseudomonas sp. ICMP 561]